jgi:hypothetical protein
MVLVLASCAAVEHRQQPLYSPLLSASDIAEITALVAQRPDIRQPIYEIATDEQRRDRATVRTGRWREVGDQADYFTVQKRRGRWRIVSPIQQDRLKRIITVS